MLICAIDDTYHALLHAADGFLLELKLPHLRLVDDGLQLLPLGGQSEIWRPDGRDGFHLQS